MVNDCPLQMEPLFTQITGSVFTVTFEMAEMADTQPAVEVPLTE